LGRRDAIKLLSLDSVAQLFSFSLRSGLVR